MADEYVSIEGLRREDLISLVQRFFEPNDMTEADGSALLARIERNVPDPNVSDLIFYAELGSAWIHR